MNFCQKMKPVFYAMMVFLLLAFTLPILAKQENDKEYTAKILEFTTEKFFLTELVDHLPASETVPTPMKVLGCIAGTPDILHHSAEIYRYMQTVANASPRVKVFSIGKTDEGKEMILVAVSDESNLQRLDRVKKILGLLADPRKIKEEEAKQLLDEGVPVYWITGSLHSQECGSPEMLMELVYRLAVEETDLISTIRENTVVIVTPILEVDGWDRCVDIYRYKKAHQDKKILHTVYWGNYVFHDNNRDAVGLALKLTENTLKTYFEWHPTIMHDLHESIPYLYTSTGTGPYNAWLDPITIDEWEELAQVEISQMTQRGVPGIWTHGFFDGWSPSYLLYAALYHNSLGRFYETFGGTGADTQVRSVGSPARRDWYRPNPPLKVVKWSFRNNIDLQQSALLFALEYVGKNRVKYLRDFYLKSKRSIAKATDEGPAAWLIPGDEKRFLAAAELVHLLQKNGIEVHQAKDAFKINKEEYAAGSLIIRMDQPYSRCADMLLDTQYYNPNDPQPYDDTGWTLGALHNVKTLRITDQKVLEVPMELLKEDWKIKGKLVDSPNTTAYLINHNAENALVKFRFDLKNIKMLAAEKSFKVDNQQFNAGSFIIPVKGNPANTRDRVEKAAETLGLTIHAVDNMPGVNTHELAVPRIAILHTWLMTEIEGWFRLTFDKLGIPYHYISVQDIRDTQNLESKYDVIIFPPVEFFRAQRLVNGISRDTPLPWKKSKEYPHLGGPVSGDDIRGGMGIEGVLNLQRFVEQGGLFIPISTNVSLPIDYGMIESAAVIKPKNVKARGTIMQTRVIDPQSPVMYGYGRSLGVISNGDPVLETGLKALLGDMDFDEMLYGKSKEPRESGRGGLKDPDVVQGRPSEPPKITGAGTGIPPEFRDSFTIYAPPDLLTIRVLLRFERADNLLVSGMLEGAEELQNRAALVDVPKGKGHILLFAFNPMWRYETQGNFCLIFNAALNYNHLDAGLPKF
jgi:hypothetical protein